MTPEIHRAVEIIADGVVEVRALADGATHSGYFDDYEALARAVEALDADPAVSGIYLTLNPVNPDLLARRANRIKMRLSRKDATTADADIVRRRWFPVDIDPVRPSGVSSTEEEHAAALAAAERVAAFLAGQGFPEPLRADSGNGAHLLYRIDLPNDDAATAVVRGALATLDALFSNDVITVDAANHNAARIWKLYGTLSRKGDSTQERPHRRSRIISVPAEMEVLSRERLEHLAGLIPREEPLPRRKTAGIDLASWLAEHGIAVRSTRPWQGGTLFVLAGCPFSSAHKDGAFAIQFANGAIFAGCHHQSCGGGAQRWPELRAMHEPKQKKKQEARAGTKEEENPAPPPAGDEYRERALAILRDGDPLGFILDTFNKTHVGDRTVAESLAMSVASRSVENTNGLHVAISGNSGKGKTHACTTMQNLIPEDSRLKGTVSDRALYYDDDLRPGTVFLFDDVSLSDDLQEVLKSATTNFREPIEHRTLTTERKLRVCTIPERCVWWLAKVDDPGDDQVMNRMLTVWIDDSAEQDRRVLEHMKEREAAGRDPAADDTLVCQAIWEAVGEEVLPVRIPFARRIGFSTTQNRRNPGMLFDLIRCHARLFYLQRDRDDDGAVVAREEDFRAAADLYAALSGATGGQETKLTKNEAAALATVAKMGVEVFTVRGLQSALGLSYQKTRRILNGYTSRGTPYSGLLEKCPAISLYDATVTEDGGAGVTVRRREQYFTFDAEVYRAWSGGTFVWLDDDPDVDSNDSSFQHVDSSCCQRENARKSDHSKDAPQHEDIHLYDHTHVQQNKGTESTHEATRSDEGGTSVSDFAVTQNENVPDHEQNRETSQVLRPLIDSTCCQRAENCCHQQIEEGSGSVPGGAVTQTGISRDREDNKKRHPDPASFSDSNCCKSAEGCCHQQIEEGSGSVSGGAVTQIGIPRDREDNQKIPRDPASFSDSNCCKSAEGCCQYGCNTRGRITTEPGTPPQVTGINPADYIPLPVSKDEPCHVCGRRPTSSVRRDSEEYLCYTCLKNAPRSTAAAAPSRRVRVQPLPGVLDHRGFERVKSEIGRCDVCKAARAVYRSMEAQTKVCEGCYARLVRDWNREEGVR
ncbi:hypothetical protein [Methanoculleus sp.]|uniref:hypothetical protein n=1 Tax=Methanoculleus sp. TaxID=90427 RepID=UPI00263353B4|nr:hypothetical protein [Methanoculleus sp.]MDI6867753.1 hypothetical protein [Methanoculleus sp.]